VTSELSDFDSLREKLIVSDDDEDLVDETTDEKLTEIDFVWLELTESVFLLDAVDVEESVNVGVEDVVGVGDRVVLFENEKLFVSLSDAVMPRVSVKVVERLLETLSVPVYSLVMLNDVVGVDVLLRDRS
jgi:hypothetical protein